MLNFMSVVSSVAAITLIGLFIFTMNINNVVFAILLLTLDIQRRVWHMTKGKKL